MLYPLKFKPRVKERIWGGQAILKKKGKTVARLSKDKLYGESWDLSSVKGDVCCLYSSEQLITSSAVPKSPRVISLSSSVILSNCSFSNFSYPSHNSSLIS